MLKDITLGQFFPADTPVHRLDPRTKLLCVILYIVALFSAKSVLTYGIMITVLAVSVLVSRVPFKSLTKGLKPVYRAALHSHADRGDRQDHVGTEGPRRGL